MQCGELKGMSVEEVLDKYYRNIAKVAPGYPVYLPVALTSKSKYFIVREEESNGKYKIVIEPATHYPLERVLDFVREGRVVKTSNGCIYIYRIINRRGVFRKIISDNKVILEPIEGEDIW